MLVRRFIGTKHGLEQLSSLGQRHCTMHGALRRSFSKPSKPTPNSQATTFILANKANTRTSSNKIKEKSRELSEESPFAQFKSGGRGGAKSVGENVTEKDGGKNRGRPDLIETIYEIDDQQAKRARIEIPANGSLINSINEFFTSEQNYEDADKRSTRFRLISKYLVQTNNADRIQFTADQTLIANTKKFFSYIEQNLRNFPILDLVMVMNIVFHFFANTGFKSTAHNTLPFNIYKETQTRLQAGQFDMHFYLTIPIFCMFTDAGFNSRDLVKRMLKILSKMEIYEIDRLTSHSLFNSFFKSTYTNLDNFLHNPSRLLETFGYMVPLADLISVLASHFESRLSTAGPKVLTRALCSILLMRTFSLNNIYSVRLQITIDTSSS
jgi:hypothetical protein